MEETRRITLKQKDCNPLFVRWLKDIVEDAESKKLKSSKIYSKALDSLERYPLTLWTGNDCSILENFGPKIIQVLNDKLEKHLKTQDDLDQSLGFKAQIEFIRSRENKQLIELIKNIENSLLPGFLNDSMDEEQEGSQDENLTQDDDIRVSQISSDDFSGDEFDLLVNNVPTKKKRMSPPTQILPKPTIITNMPKTPPFIWQLPTTSSQSPGYQPVMLEDDPEDEFDKLVNQNFSPAPKTPKKDHKLFRRSKTFNGIPADKPELTYSPIPKFIEAAATSSPLPTPQHFDSEIDRLVAKYNLSPIKPVQPIRPVEPVKSPEKVKPAKKTKQLKITELPAIASTSSSTQPSRTLQRHKSAATLRTAPRIDEEVEEEEEIPIFVADLDILDYEIVLLVDTQETTGGKSNSSSDLLIKGLNDNTVNLEVRHLNVGDFLWIARNKTDKSKEYVLPYIIERKRVDDLSSSIKDGRFHEQKFRLKQCGIENVIYLIEAQAKSRQMGHAGIPFTTLLQAATNTQIHSKFTVKFTESHQHTILYLTVMTSFLENIFKNNSPLQFKLLNFEKFNKSAVKQKRLTIRETFIKQLLSLKGLSVEIAMAIVSKYPTPRNLYLEYRKNSTEDNEKLLTLIHVGSLKRGINANISKAIFHLYTSDKVT